MAIKSKYDVLTKWLQECGCDTVRLTFDELNSIITIPQYAYYDRGAWANCTTKNASPFHRSWQNAGYRVSDIILNEKWVEFSKDCESIVFEKKPLPLKKIEKGTIPTTPLEELLLCVPDKFKDLESDEYFMVKLSKLNSCIVEECIAADPEYQFTGKEIMKKYFSASDYSEKAYFEIINRIATENSTRTPKETMICFASYCADKKNMFLERLESGDITLVDDLTNHVVISKERRDKSLASKLCRYLNEWLFGGCAYTINDSVVREVLPYYLAYYKIDYTLWYGLNFEKLSYVEFYNIFSALRNEINVLNNHQLDHLIWYSYKNDPIRKEVAKAMSKVL